MKKLKKKKAPSCKQQASSSLTIDLGYCKMNLSLKLFMFSFKLGAGSYHNKLPDRNPATGGVLVISAFNKKWP